MVFRRTRMSKWALMLVPVILLCNILLYQSSVQLYLDIHISKEVVFGSLLDLVVVLPALMYAAFRLSKKQLAGIVVFGLVLARFILPEAYFAQYTILLYAGLAVEVIVVMGELALVFLLVKKIPDIKGYMRESGNGPLFSLLPAAIRNVKDHFIVRLITSEILTIYYGLMSWKRKAPVHRGVVTMHQTTSHTAMNLMLIHAIVLESVGLHWWLHDIQPVLSMVLLILNVYGVILFLAEIQIARLHPLEVRDGRIYIGQGLQKRIVFPIENIEHMDWGGKPSEDSLLLMYKDFEEVEPQVVITLKEEAEATLFMGRKVMVREVAIRVDDPNRLKELLA
ncbi:conserved membrane hypothetical protein [Bacillus sp. 349Y]|nr:conserved membrane hypothetical protein [Bacillus sp. 349Y]